MSDNNFINTSNEIGEKLFKATIEFFEETGRRFKENFFKMSLEELVEDYSKNIDNIVLMTEVEYDCKYIGGEFKVHRLNEDYFETIVSLYFQDKNKEWKKTKSKSKPQSMKYLNSTAIESLKKEVTVTFDIDLPEKDDKDKSGRNEKAQTSVSPADDTVKDK